MTLVLRSVLYTTYLQRFELTDDGKMPILAGAMLEFTVVDVLRHEIPNIYLIYQDRTNKRWHRDLDDGRFLEKDDPKSTYRLSETGPQYEMTRPPSSAA